VHVDYLKWSKEKASSFVDRRMLYYFPLAEKKESRSRLGKS